MPVELTAAENLSNLTWLVLATLSLVWWHRKVRSTPGIHRGRSFAALIFVLLLLFPIISLSDDLHPDLVIAAEGDGKSKRLQVASSHAPGSHSSAVTQLAVGAQPFACAASLQLLSLLALVDSVLALDAPTRSPRGRSPPLSSLV